MEKALTVGGVVLAAGNGSRFGGNKLLAQVEGKPLFRWALEAVPADRVNRVAVVTRFEEVERLVNLFGFQTVRNEHPEAGQSLSMQLGLGAVSDCAGALFMAADMPYLRRESAAALVDLWRREPDKIAAAGCHGVPRNPCLFPARFYPELRELTGDTGGKPVLLRHKEEVSLLEVPEKELRDVDRRADLEGGQSA